MYALGRETSAVLLLRVETEGGPVEYMESYPAVGSSLDDVFIVRGEWGIFRQR